MPTGDDVGPAQLQDLDLANRPQLVAAVAEPDDAVGDGELREGRHLLARVLPHEQARGTPARYVDRQVVVERPQRRGVAQQIPQRLEAVDDDDRRLFLLDAADDLAERLVGALASHHGAEIRDDHPFLGD